MARIGLVTAWASRANGGIFEAVLAHVGLLQDAGHEAVVFAVEDASDADDRCRLADVPVVTSRRIGPRVIGFAPAMPDALEAAALDIVHLHGIWMYPSHAASTWAARTRRPYVISPHGMLDPWITGRGTMKKAVATHAYERRSWRRAAAFHALTGAEAADIARVTGRDATTVIPNPAPECDQGAAARGPVLLSLGRIHPKKNGLALIDAWEAAADVLGPLGGQLIIAGWGAERDVAALTARIARRGRDDIRFVGPLHGDAKQQALAEARFLALPSHSEGLPVAVLEAWAAGTPTLMSRHCHLPEGFAAGAAIDCGTSRDDIAAALRQAFTLSPAAWRAMSHASATLASDRFSRETVAAQWQRFYASLLAERMAA